MILDKLVLVSALQPDNANADREGYVSAGWYARINIQPASAELTVLSEGEVFKTYKAFTTSSGIIENMKLTVSGTSQNYYVRGREVYDYGVNNHYELVLQREKIR